MNVKRIAWESHGVEHRTVPTDQRMAGGAISPEPEVVQEKVTGPAAQAPATAAAQSAPMVSQAARPEEQQPAAQAAPHTGSTSGVDRAAIARVVENVLAAQGIARGGGAPKLMPASVSAQSAAGKESASASSIAAEIADRFFGSAGKTKAAIADPVSSASASATKTSETPELPVPPALNPDAGKKHEPPAKAAVEIQVFVSENDVRRAMTRSEKIFISRKTILTPSARDLGLEHEVFVETEADSIR
jgi:hypothetical protein